MIMMNGNTHHGIVVVILAGMSIKIDMDDRPDMVTILTDGKSRTGRELIMLLRGGMVSRINMVAVL